MTVLDAYAVLAYLRDEPAAAEVAGLLSAPSRLTAVNAAEVLDRLVRVFDRDPDDVHAHLAMLERQGMRIETVSATLGLRAGDLRAKHYHRERAALSLADCVAAAAALAAAVPLATSDPPLAALVKAEGGQVHGLPDSTGRRP